MLQEKWQKALATDTLSSYTHDYPTLSADVAEAIYPIYEDLNNVKLLERCASEFTQNNNESFFYRQLIWKISPCGSKVVKIAAYIAAGKFNEGTKSLLYFMRALRLSLGIAAHACVNKEDAERVMIDARAHGTMREGRMARRQHQLDLEATDTAECPSYGTGIDDTMQAEEKKI
ncbi:uncharacterized protein TNIN_369391 [Trichonephila inaurata madagascariensis]|uniref:Uncharacterized protein n=1 Tax=Trichonephila inaurata madagascariensis TaxID=2747483 RepID=A0A8X6X0Z6_9ARAC|nr:uncharacterized protein TNIN_369391 [Trichonephila inaurata madagascariensis]